MVFGTDEAQRMLCKWLAEAINAEVYFMSPHSKKFFMPPFVSFGLKSALKMGVYFLGMLRR